MRSQSCMIVELRANTPTPTRTTTPPHVIQISAPPLNCTDSTVVPAAIEGDRLTRACRTNSARGAISNHTWKEKWPKKVSESITALLSRNSESVIAWPGAISIRT